ncbi:unnamed protein product [Prorocentrum cordatum]|uniref:Subtilisin n=1 Tax=Prorocentrum cordatum TaxID=2364126 RepID=A0ABN9U6Y2_9DINO|nr:unnamed protein product [Polarella glacialis]
MGHTGSGRGTRNRQCYLVCPCLRHRHREPCQGECRRHERSPGAGRVPVFPAPTPILTPAPPLPAARGSGRFAGRGDAEACGRAMSGPPGPSARGAPCCPSPAWRPCRLGPPASRRSGALATRKAVGEASEGGMLRRPALAGGSPDAQPPGQVQGVGSTKGNRESTGGWSRSRLVIALMVMLFAAQATTGSATETAAAAEALYIDGPRVASFAWSGPCCYSTASSRVNAEAACSADPDCYVLRDNDCTDTGVRYCYSAISDIVANWEGKNSRACTYVKNQPTPSPKSAPAPPPTPALPQTPAPPTPVPTGTFDDVFRRLMGLSTLCWVRSSWPRTWPAATALGSRWPSAPTGPGWWWWGPRTTTTPGHCPGLRTCSTGPAARSWRSSSGMRLCGRDHTGRGRQDIIWVRVRIRLNQRRAAGEAPGRRRGRLRQLRVLGGRQCRRGPGGGRGLFFKDENAGSAHVFDGASGAQLAKLVAADAAAGDYFGRSVAVSRGRGPGGGVAYGVDDAGGISGSAYVFDGASGAQLARLAAAAASDVDHFGWSVAVGADGARAVVGARHGESDAGSARGAAPVFDRTTPDAPTG